MGEPPSLCPKYSTEPIDMADPNDLEKELSDAFARMLNAQPDIAAESAELVRNASGSPCLQENEAAPSVPEDDSGHSGPGTDGNLEANATLPLPTIAPNAGPDEVEQFMQAFTAQYGKYCATLAPTPHDQIPVAVLPEYTRGGLDTSQSMADSAQIGLNGLEGVTDLVTRALRFADAAQEYLNQATNTTEPPIQSAGQTASPSSSTAPPPDLAQHLSATLSRTDSRISSLSQTFGGDLMYREITRGLQGSSVYLNATATNLHLKLQSLPADTPEYREAQSAFGLTLLHLYELESDDRFLDGAVGATTLALSRDAEVVLATTAGRVRNWAFSQRLLARRDGNLDALQRAIEVSRQTLVVSPALFPANYPSHRALAMELAECLLDRYRALGALQDLDSALEILSAFGATAASEDSDNATQCVLSELHLERFVRTWDLGDIDKALYTTLSLEHLDEPLVGAPFSAGAPPHPDAVRGLHVLARVWAARCDVVMDADDLDKAVTYALKAVERCAEGGPLCVVYLTDLAMLLYRRFEADGNVRDLEESVERLGVAAHLPIRGSYTHHPARAGLGLARARHGEYAGDLGEIEEGIRGLQLAGREFSGGAHIEAQIERDLATALFLKFGMTQGADDLDDAVRYASSAFDRAPPDDQQRASLAVQLGHMLSLRAKRAGAAADSDRAVRILRDAAQGSGRPAVRLKAAMEWAEAASTRGPEATLDALKVALEILPLIAWAGNRMVVQYRTLASLSADVGPWAAACAIACGRLEDAVAYLERGRNVLWSQSLQLRLGQGHGRGSAPSGKPSERTEYSGLSSFLSRNAEGIPDPLSAVANAEFKGPSLEMYQTAQRLRTMYEGLRAQAMEHPAYRPGDFDRIDAFKSMYRSLYGDASLHGAAKRLMSLRERFDQSGQDASGISSAGELRRDPGLASLLERGHIVFLNVHSTRCDAIILTRGVDGDVSFGHVPLPGLSVDEIRGWAEAIQVGIYDLGQGGMGVRDFDEIVLIPILQGLWSVMAVPVLAHLGQADTSAKLMRIWWCPTGPLALLPIHAAGPYERNAPGLPDLVISSYMPTLHSLLRAHTAPLEPLSLLAIGQPETPGQAPLPAVLKELSAIQRSCERLARVPTIMVGRSATISAVSRALPSHTWLHFSGHAHQDPDYAFASAFYVHDGPLRLGALMQLDLSRVQFAFLSACLTSAGDERLPDESIHLAAGMHFAGVRSAVATLWTVSDRAAAFTAERVYGHLMREGLGEPDPLEAAEALHRAVGAMKAAGRPMIYWVPFLHTGV